MAVTAIQDRLALDLADAKAFIGVVEDDYDVQITLYLESAKEKADAYINNPFLDTDGSELSIPSTIKEGVLEYVYARWCELNAREREELDLQANPGQGNQFGQVLKGQAIRSIEREEGETITFFAPNNSKARKASPKSWEQIRSEYFAAYRFIPGF